jgi:hypothetical protein
MDLLGSGEDLNIKLDADTMTVPLADKLGGSVQMGAGGNLRWDPEKLSLEITGHEMDPDEPHEPKLKM